MFRKLAKFFTYKNSLLLCALVAFFIALRWNNFTAPFERDEGVYAYSAWIMRKGIMPYEYSFPYKPPMIIYTHLLSQFVFGDVIWGPRLFLAAASLATILVVFLITKKEIGIRAAWIAAWLLTVMLILPVNLGNGVMADVYYAAVTEIFMLLPIVLFLYLYLLKKGKANIRYWILSGILFALGVGYKPICPLLFAYIYVFWIRDTWKEQPTIKALIFKLGAAALGAVVAGLIILLPFLLHDGGKAIWGQMFGFSTCFVDMTSNNFGIGQLIHRVAIMSKYYWVLFLALVYLAVTRPKNWIFYLGLFLVSFMSVYYSLIGHYFLQIMPFFAIASAYAIDNLLKERPFTKLNPLLIVGAIILTIVFPIRSLFTKTPEELGLWIYGHYDPFYEAQFLGNKIAAITKPDDYIYVEGSDPEIVYFAQRKSAVRTEWADFMTSDCRALKAYQEQYLKDLKDKSPEVIALCMNGSCGYLWSNDKAKYFTTYLLDMVNQDYAPVGGWIPQDDKGYWLEPINNDDIPKARMVLFKKKPS